MWECVSRGMLSTLTSSHTTSFKGVDVCVHVQAGWCRKHRPLGLHAQSSRPLPEDQFPSLLTSLARPMSPLRIILPTCLPPLPSPPAYLPLSHGVSANIVSADVKHLLPCPPCSFVRDAKACVH